MPSNQALKFMNDVHRLLISATRGRLGWNAMGMPVLEVTTIGRRSGEARPTMLTAPLHKGGRYVIVASRGGDDRHPAWYLNMLDEPVVQVSVKGGPAEPMTARQATDDERSRMWPLITGKYPNYAGYQKRTTRQIPLVILEPVAATA
ncbi:nitroreductase/quinone reductase family protein [Marisediminicola senii]|uniref:nitroreductase/quinone reductase family protein n=1 Tax=Marisediminicola senii TaxID=2711233 RepID=UPI0013EC9694|nr:nitroreductase/quinone reductase family protein [Marisediminicola senii]